MTECKHVNDEKNLYKNLNCGSLGKAFEGKNKMVHCENQRWTDFVYSEKKSLEHADSHIICIPNENYSTMNCVGNALLVLEFGLKCYQFENIFNKNNEIKVSLGDIVFLDCGFDSLLEILKMHKSMYDDMIYSLYKRNRLEIPIHNIIFNCHLFLAYFAEYNKDYVIDVRIGEKCLKHLIYKCYLNYEVLPWRNQRKCPNSPELLQQINTEYEQIFYDHVHKYYETFDDELKIPLNCNDGELIRNISIKIISGDTERIVLDNRPFTKTTDPFYTHYMNKKLNDGYMSYLFSPTLTKVCNNKTYVDYSQKNDDMHVIIKNCSKGKKLEVLMVIRYDNFIQNNGAMYFKHYNKKL